MPVPIISIFDVPDLAAAFARGADLLDSGGVVVMPTETVYGAAGRLDVAAARPRLRALRGDVAKPFAIHVAAAADAMRYLGPVSDLGRRLMRKLWPGPVGLTFDVPADDRAAITAKLGLAQADLYDGAGRITLRCPDHPVATELLARAGGPVVLTIAGSGGGGPTFRADVMATELDGKVDLIFNAGPTRFNKPSTLLRVLGDKYEVVRAGVYDERIVERLLRTTVLFVCSGNTCRSPMAEAIARSVLSKSLRVPETELERKGINVLSAGTYAMPGSRATPQAVDAVRDLGVDLTRHRSRPLTIELIHQADMIYTMGAGHAHVVRSLVPGAADKVATLDPNGDIDDPIGSDLAVYKQLAGQLTTLIERRLQERPIVG